MISTDTIRAKLALLVERFGFRFSNLDARRAGISEHVLHAAACRGLARIESTSIVTCVSTYLVFA